MGKESLKKIIKWLFIIVLIFVIGGLGGIVMERYVFPKLSAYNFFSSCGFIQKANENVTVINKTEQVIVKGEDSINEVASQPATAVVNIVSIKKTALTQKKPSALAQEVKNGTGVIITSDGLLVTYRDAIIEEDSEYKILAFNGSTYDGELLGVDDFSNLAYLKVDASNLPAIPLANSNDFRPGKKLITIGNSFEEYQNRFSTGILSSVNKAFNISGKTVASSEKLEGVLETDFNGQHDYVGGPLVDYNGELVGIIGSVKFDNESKYFQIPSNKVRDTMNFMLESSFDDRAVLGISYMSITKSYAITNGLKREKGALVYSPSGRQSLAVIAGSAAQKAGFKVGDIVTAADGNEINLDNPLSYMVSKYRKGEEAEFAVLRGEEEIKIEVKF